MAWEILTKFVEKAIGNGVSRDRIAQALEKAGWQPAQVKSAMDAFAETELPIAVPRPTISATARELFLYLMLFSSLYVTIMGLGTILYQLINLAFPDPADFYGGYYLSLVGDVESRLRSGLSSVVVFLPVYLFIDWKIEALKQTGGGQGGSNVRRKLTYLTLYLTMIVLLFDASWLVNFWLNGELDQRVALKCLVVAGLAALVLGRYLHEMRSDEHLDAKHVERVRRIALGILVLVSLTAVILAAINVDSPGSERKQRADQTRETALSQIDNSIVTYFRAYKKLPESLAELERIQHMRFPRDPETGKRYRYEQKGDRTYLLCTTFRRERTAEQLIAESSPYSMTYGSSAFAEHPAGDHCFDMEVKETPSYGPM